MRPGATFKRDRSPYTVWFCPHFDSCSVPCTSVTKLLAEFVNNVTHICTLFYLRLSSANMPITIRAKSKIFTRDGA